MTRLRAGLYSPLLFPNSIPPKKYPPQFHIYKELIAICVLYTLSHFISSFANIVTWLTLAWAGYEIVSAVFLERKRLFFSRYKSSREIIKLCISVCVIYFILLRYIKQPQWPSCVTGFYIGLHFVYMDNVTVFQSIGCKIVQKAGWKSMTSKELAVIICGFCGCYITVTALLASIDHEMVYYAIKLYLFLFIGLIIAFSQYHQNHNFHSHHYFNFFMLLPAVTCFQNHAIASAAHGFVFGSFVEGVACWGMDPLFHNALSHTTDFATLFWTTVVLMLPSEARWICCLQYLKQYFALVASADTLPGSEEIQITIRSYCKDILLSMDHDLHSQAVSNPCPIEASNISIIAIIQLLVIGLASGTNDLERMGPNFATVRRHKLSSVVADIKWQLTELEKQLSQENREALFKKKCELIIELDSILA